MWLKLYISIYELKFIIVIVMFHIIVIVMFHIIVIVMFHIIVIIMFHIIVMTHIHTHFHNSSAFHLKIKIINFVIVRIIIMTSRSKIHDVKNQV